MPEVIPPRKKNGKFTAMPNSRRSIQKRRKAAREAEARNVGRPSQTVRDAGPTLKTMAPTVATAQDETPGDIEAGESSAAETTPETNEPGGDRSTEFFSEPAPPKSADEIIDNNDDEEKPDGEAPRKSRQQKKRAQMLAQQLVQGTDGIFGIYVKTRHSWLLELPAEVKAQLPFPADDLSKLTQAEKDVLISSLARYIEENNIELSPGAELAMFFCSMYGGRVVALEGILLAMKKANR